MYTGDERKKIGTVKIISFDFIRTPKVSGVSRILRSYGTDSYAEPPLEPFADYIIEQIVSSNGIQSRVRKVGVDVTEDEFNELRLRKFPADSFWAEPSVQAILLREMLLERNASWVQFDPAEVQMRNGFYRLPDDERRISEFEGVFTPEIALEELTEIRGASQTVDNRGARSRGFERSSPNDREEGGRGRCVETI